MALPESLRRRLRLPLIAAPMTAVSTLELVREACRSGVIGSFPTFNAKGPGALDAWLAELRELAATPGAAPCAPNLVVHRTNNKLEDEVAALVRNRVELVITSVGSPEGVVPALHDAGALVLADVASFRHAERALAAGVDGLVLLSAGAGGQTGWANPLAFVSAVRGPLGYDGPLVAAGGIADGAALWAAEVAGHDLAYMGTRFIATTESGGSADYKAALVRAGLDDITLTSAVTGIPASIVTESLAGFEGDVGIAAPGGFERERLHTRRSAELWSAGHSVCGVDAVIGVAQLVESTEAEYDEARRRTRSLLDRARPTASA